jgi:hypothetical protein
MSAERLLHDATTRLECALARLTFHADEPASIQLCRVSVDRALMDLRALGRELHLVPCRRLDDQVVLGEPQTPETQRFLSEHPEVAGAAEVAPDPGGEARLVSVTVHSCPTDSERARAYWASRTMKVFAVELEGGPVRRRRSARRCTAARVAR